jgi:dihydropteroate synthase
MGILNVTPDSFSDGGRFASRDEALRQTERMLEEGAAIIDVGGESTRPRGSVYGEGALAVDAEEEMRRVLPVIEAVAARFPEAILSVDSYKPEVVRAALEAGAHIASDVTGLRLGDGVARAAAEHGAALVVMHALGRPGEMPHEHRYDDVVDEVGVSLAESVETALAAGVRAVAVDPGFGFGKSAAENLRVIGRVDELRRRLGRPVLVGISRKSTIGAVLGGPGAPAPVDERLFGTLGATAVAVLRGASIVRTHDVRPTAELLALVAAIEKAVREETVASRGEGVA